MPIPLTWRHIKVHRWLMRRMTARLIPGLVIFHPALFSIFVHNYLQDLLCEGARGQDLRGFPRCSSRLRFVCPADLAFSHCLSSQS